MFLRLHYVFSLLFACRCVYLFDNKTRQYSSRRVIFRSEAICAVLTRLDHCHATETNGRRVSFLIDACAQCAMQSPTEIAFFFKHTVHSFSSAPTGRRPPLQYGARSSLLHARRCLRGVSFWMYENYLRHRICARMAAFLTRSRRRRPSPTAPIPHDPPPARWPGAATLATR